MQNKKHTSGEKTDKALKISETRYRRLFETAQDGILILDGKTGEIADVNPFLLKLLGYTHEEFLGKQLWEIGFFKDIDASRTAFQELEQNNYIRYEDLPLKTKAGGCINVEFVSNVYLVDHKRVIQCNIRDITERKRAVETLQHQAKLLAEVNDAIVVSDANYHLTTWNAAAEFIYGWKAEEVLGRVGLKVLQTEFPEADKKQMLKTINATGRYRGEVTQVRKDGTRIPIEVSSIVLHDKQGQITGYVSINRDITEHKKKEEEIWQLSKFPSENPNPILRIARNGRILYANQTSAPILATWGREVGQKVPGNWREQIRSVHGSGESEEVELDCQGRIFSCSITPIANEDYVNFYGRDITKRKLAEIALKEQVEELSRLATVVRDSNDAVIMHDLEGKVLAWNRGAKETYGYTEAEALGMNVQDIVAEPDREAALALIQRIKKGEIVKSFELRRITKDGRILDVWLTTTLLTDEKGKPVAIATTERDITERKHGEQYLQNRANGFSALYDTAQELAGSMTLPTILQTILQRAITLLATTFGTIYLYNAERGDLELAAVQNFKAPLGTRGKLDKGTSGRVAQTRQPLYVEDYQHWENRIREYDDIPVRAVLEVPMIYHDELIGTLGVGEVDTERKFSEEDKQLLSLFAAQAASAFQNARLFLQTDKHLQHLYAVSEIDRAISSSFDLHLSLGMITEQVTKQQGVDAADVLLFNPDLQTLTFSTGYGFRTEALQHTHLRLGEGLAGRAALEHQSIHIPNLISNPNGLSKSPKFANEGFVAYFAIPLISKGMIQGVLETFTRKPFEPDKEWLDFLNTLAGQAAIAIDSITQFENLQRLNSELFLAYDATIEGWSKALDLRDKETEGHTQRVTEITLQLARAMGAFDEAELVHIRRGALLHDIGKMGIPDGILFKTSPLTDEEWVIMRKHPFYAKELLSPITYLRNAQDIPYCHHEKWDGTGYPQGLKGEQIPMSARLFAVVDVWDALRSDRPYRKAWSKEKALAYIQEQVGKYFDPKVVDAFLRNIDAVKE